MSYATQVVRPSAVAAEAMIATSQPLATAAGLQVLRDGGNAVDAALAAAAVLCVVEPMSTGLGGDLFALVWSDGMLHALDAAGPSPATAERDAPVGTTGPRSVTVPGAVAGWGALSERFGRFGLDTVLTAAIDAARTGVVCGPMTTHHWRRATVPDGMPRPRVGSRRITVEGITTTLEAIAVMGASALYEGPIAERIAAATWLEPEDLARYAPRWVETLRLVYRGVTVCALPPPSQGVAALEALGLLAEGDPSPAAEITCVRLALEDAFSTVRDGADVNGLLSSSHLAARRAQHPGAVTPPSGGTVHLAVVDGNSMAVSMMQSVFQDFGSGIVVDGGIVLNNRAACFAINGSIEPGVRPYHTLAPAMLLRGESLLGPVGVMGGLMQAQGQVQLVTGIVDSGLDPQAALDRPRFRVNGDELLVEPGFRASDEALAGLGVEVVCSTDWWEFGAGNAILVGDGALVGGSDSRADGYAGGY